MFTIQTESADQTELLGRRIGELLERGAVIVLQGPLGSGKTVIAKGIARGLGITSLVTSPSFTIAVEYAGEIPFRHIDLYRTGSDEELELLGLGELVSGEGVTAVEWGEKADHFLAKDHIRIVLSIREDGNRIIEIHDPANVIEGRMGAGIHSAG